MTYRMFSKSILGPKYAKNGWECQDSSGTKELAGVQIISVADGHGNNDCFRSAFGAQAAVQVAHTQTELYCSMLHEEPHPVKFSETGIANLKFAIYQKWRELVKSNWDEFLNNHCILGDDEIRYERVSKKYKARYASEDTSVVDQYLYIAYGTTLLFAVSIESQMLILQIGDGTCVVLQQNGEFKTPVPPDQNNFFNVTVSLSEADAHLKIRHKILDCEPTSPATPVAVFLSSDGVDDCYPVYGNAQRLYGLYTVIIENILREGFEVTDIEIMNSLLPGMTAKGSQDDISLAYFIYGDTAVLKGAYENIKDIFKPDSEENPVI